MNKILRYIILGQLIMVALIAIISTPANGTTYIEAILLTLGVFAVLDIISLGIAYFIRRREFNSVSEFFKEIW